MSSDYYDYSASLSHASQVGQGAPQPVRKEQSTWMTDRDAEKMCSLFADGLSAGIGYSRILDFMERQKLDGKLIDRLRLSVLEHGDQLGEAFARFGVLDGPSRKLILVAEEQGTLPQTFKEQSNFYGRRFKRRKRGVYAMVYPVIIICLGVFFFAENIGMIMDVTFASDTWEQVIDLGIKSAIKSVLFVMLSAFAGYLFLNMPVDSTLRSMAGRLWFAVPFFSGAARQQAVANFCRYLQQSVNAGMDVYRSIDLAADASGHPSFIKSAPRVMQLLEEGYPLDTAFRELRGMPEEVLDYIGIGEETGRLDEQLRFLTERYDELANETSERTIIYFTNIVIFTVIVSTLIVAFTSVIGIFEFM